MALRKAKQLENGDILFDSSQAPPKRFLLHTQDKDNPWLFHPDFPSCVQRYHGWFKLTGA